MKVKSPRIGGFRGRSLIIERINLSPDSAMLLKNFSRKLVLDCLLDRLV